MNINKSKSLFNNNKTYNLSLLSFLILSPELSFYLLPIIDGYFILLIYLLIYSLRNGIKKSTVILSIYSFLILLLIFIFQYYFHSEDTYWIRTHTGDDSLRDIGSTFGDYKIGTVYISIKYLFNFFIKVTLGIFIYNFFISVKSQVIYKLCIHILKISVIYQIIFFLLHQIGQLKFITKLFFYQKTLRLDYELIPFRYAMARFSGGFSEPSFMILILLWSFMTIIYFSHMHNIKHNILKFIFWFSIITFTTIATSSIFLFILLPFLYFKKNVYNIFLASILFTIHLFYFIIDLDFVRDILTYDPSTVIRFLRYTNLKSLNSYELIFGTGFTYIYTQPPLFNIILQTGFVGLSFFMLLVFTKKLKITFFLSILILLILSPQIGTSFFIIFIFSFLAFSKHNKNELPCLN